MKRKKLCTILAAAVACANIMPVWGITPTQNTQIEGNAIVIGDHLFEMDTHGKEFTLNRFMEAIRSIDSDKENAIYYKDYKGDWYELVKDPMLKKTVELEQISNKLEHVFGSIDTKVSKELLQEHITILPTGFKEAKDKAGTFENKVIITLSNQTTATFKNFEEGEVDSISGASEVSTVPEGLTLKMKRLSDKQIELTLAGIAAEHAPNINTIPNTTDYNENGVHGDIKLLMLPELFEQVEAVEKGGVYAACDVLYKEGSLEADGILNLATQKVLNVEQVHYGVLELQKGTLEDYNITLNGEVIRPTPVDDKGSLFKFEINPLEVAKVQVTSKDNKEASQTIHLATGKAPFTGVIQNEDPERILTSGPVKYLDYYLNNYNQEGQIRVEPAKVTFDLVNEGEVEVDKVLPQLSAEPTLMGEDISVHFENTSAESKQWKDNIYAVYVDYGMSENTRVPVQFEIGEEMLSIQAESTALQNRNGKHHLIIKSNGHPDARVTVEIVKEAGNVMLSGDFGPWANQELLFELHDFNYSIINPIYEVVLDGETLEGGCEDYYVISNLVRLKNDCLDKLGVGSHTLEIKAEGYKDFVKTFVLEQAPKGEQNPTLGQNSEPMYQVPKMKEPIPLMDAVSSASSGGSDDSEGGSGGGGTGIMRANVIFDFDLIANAKILSNLNRTTPYAQSILDWWQSLTKDAIITPNGEDKLVDYEYFKNYASVQSEDYITFEELYEALPEQGENKMTKGHPGNYLNRPYEVKNMLEDGLLGDGYAYQESSAKKSPALYGSEGYYAEDIVISYEGTEDISQWESAIQSVMSGVSYLNYSVDPIKRQIIIPTTNNGIVYGENMISVQAEGYTAAKASINVSKRNESELEVSKDELGNIYISGLSQDFAKAIMGLSVDGKNLFEDSQVGEDKGGYILQGEVITLRKENFERSDGTQKTLKIIANGYNDMYVPFTPNKTEDVKGEELAQVPDFIGASERNSYEVGQDVLVVVSNIESSYKLAEVQINGNQVANKGNTGYDEFRIDGSYFEEAGSYEITLKAKGYKDKVISVNIIEKDMRKPVPDYVEVIQPEITSGNQLEVNIGSFIDIPYIRAFTKIEVDGNKVYTREDLGVREHTSVVYIKDLSVGDHTLVISAEGYKDKTVEVSVKLKEVPQIVKMRVDKKDIATDTVTTTTGSAIKVVVGEIEYSTKKTYLDELQAIVIDGTTYDKKDLGIAEESIGILSTIKFIPLNPDLLVEGEHTICLKANHYEDKEFILIIKSN